MIIQGSPEILQGPRGLNNQFGAFDAAGDGVENLYLAVLGREADAGGLAYFKDRFGDTIEPQEAIIFQQMAAAEIQARNAYLAEQASLSAQAAAEAKAIEAEIARKEREGKTYFFAVDPGPSTSAADTAAAAAAAAATAADATKKKAIADAYAAAQAASAKAAAATTLAAKQAADALRVRALLAVKALYLQVLGREGEQAGLDYFADRFGDVIDPDELQIFSDMAQPEIDARNKYLADMAAKSKEDAAKAKAIADQFAATAAAAKAKADAAAATGGGGDDGTVFDTDEFLKMQQKTQQEFNKTLEKQLNPGISPLLILAAAAAFFIGR